MNTLLLFFALPVATVILAIVLQKILNNPLLVAATFFAIYLVVAFTAFDCKFFSICNYIYYTCIYNSYFSKCNLQDFKSAGKSK